MIRIALDVNTKFFDMENEVTVTELKDIELNLEPIKKGKRFKRSCEGKMLILSSVLKFLEMRLCI